MRSYVHTLNCSYFISLLCVAHLSKTQPLIVRDFLIFLRKVCSLKWRYHVQNEVKRKAEVSRWYWRCKMWMLMQKLCQCFLTKPPKWMKRLLNWNWQSEILRDTIAHTHTRAQIHMHTRTCAHRQAQTRTHQIGSRHMGSQSPSQLS